MEQLDASVVVRCYNEAEHLEKLLYGLSQQEGVTYEVVLVDSGSTDGSLAIAEEFGVDLITNISPDRFSFGRALNYGCEAANGEYCVFISSHCYPKRTDWLNALINKFNDNKIALVYGKQRGGDSTKFSEGQIFEQWFPEFDIDNQHTPFANNANAAIRRELWKELQYNEQLTGLEDIDWAKRAKEQGYRISYASEAEVVHIHDETPSQIYHRYQREANAYKEIFPDQSFTIVDFFKMFLINTLSDYISAVNQNDLWGNARGIIIFRFLQFWGTYRGFKCSDQMSEQLRMRCYYPKAKRNKPNAQQEYYKKNSAKIDYPAKAENN